MCTDEAGRTFVASSRGVPHSPPIACHRNPGLPAAADVSALRNKRSASEQPGRASRPVVNRQPPHEAVWGLREASEALATGTAGRWL
jgi:hypothetical protein